MTGYERLCYWFTIPEYQKLRETLTKTQATCTDSTGNTHWTQEYAEAFHAVKQWEDAHQ